MPNVFSKLVTANMATVETVVIKEGRGVALS
jgi:hypothetical protein